MPEKPSDRPGTAAAMGLGGLGPGTGVNHAAVALGALSEGVVMQLATGEIVVFNPAAERLLGLSRDQMEGRTPPDPGWSAIHEDGSPFPGEAHPARATLRTGEALRGVVMGIRTPAGALRWVTVDTEPIPGTDGRPAAVVTTFVDTTDFRRAREALAEEKERFREVFENSGEAIFLTDPAGAIFAANPTACRMFGQTEEEFRRIGRSGIVDARDPRLPAALAERERTGVFRGELNCVRGDGSVFPGEVVSVSFTGASGIERTSTNIRDLSERKRDEESRRASEELYRQIVETTHEGVWRIDSDQKTTFVNQRMADMIGTSPEEMLGRSPFSFMDEEDRADAEGKLERGKRGISESHERRFRKKDGSEVWTILTGSPLYLSDGTYAGALAMVTDISEARRADEELRKRNAFVETLLENAPIGFAVNTIDNGHRVYVSGKFETIYGLAPGSILGIEDFFEKVYLDPVFREEIRVRILGDLATGDPSRMRWESIPIATPAGETRYVTATNIPLFDQNLMISTVQDVTEHRKAEEALLALHAELEERVHRRTSDLAETIQELESFSYSVSHDLRAPLRAIEGFSAMVAKDAGGSLGAENQRRLEVVRTNARRMSALIDDLLTFSRTGRQDLRRGRLVMKSLAQSAFEEVAGGSDAKARIDFSLGDLPDAEGDPALVRQVWMNLLSNAVKYSARTERSVIHVSGTVEGDLAVYHVRDNGVGFDPKYAGKLFGVFQRLHGVTEFEGTGIGLALVKRIVNRHQGRVWAEGVVGKGATFSFSLPVKGRSDKSNPWRRLRTAKP